MLKNKNKAYTILGKSYTILGYTISAMAHTIRDKAKLLNRVRRVRGQVQAIERALENEDGCSNILQLIAASRGAINSLMAEVLEGHVRYHVVNPDSKPASAEAKAAQELIDVVRAYLR